MPWEAATFNFPIRLPAASGRPALFVQQACAARDAEPLDWLQELPAGWPPVRRSAAGGVAAPTR